VTPEFHVFLLALEQALWDRHAMAVKFKQRSVAVILLALIAAIKEARTKV